MSFSSKKAFPFCALVSLLFFPWGEARPAEKEFRLSDLYREPAGGAPPASPLKKGDGVARALDALLGGRTLPIPCATSVVLDVRRHRDLLSEPMRDALRLVTIRPSLPRDGSHLTRDGRYTIHYTLDPSSPDALPGTDSDFNGVPDRVDQVELALERAAAVVTDTLRWPRPVPASRADRYDVFLLSLAGGRTGLTAPEREIPSTPQDDASSHLVIDSRLDGPALDAAVIHQFAHASLLALSTRAPAWWTEATAAWLEVQVTADPAPLREAIGQRLERLDLSLASDSLPVALGNYVWTSYLADRKEGNPELIRQIWQEVSLRGSEPFPVVLDDVLRRFAQEDLGESYREFTRWTLFTGTADDGNHFRLGGLLPSPISRTSHSVFPAESAGWEAVEPLGAAVYRFVGDGSRGGLRIRFDGETPGAFEVDLVIRPARSARPHLVELVVDDSGQAEAGIPWRDVREAALIVRNVSREGGPARFRYSAQMDPLFPFDLSSFSALPASGGITLQWTTSREVDLLGWNVYRSSDPDGIFLRMNPVAIPSAGDSGEETDYIYQDTTAAGGHRYFYRVEAITILGLPEQSFPISARALEPEPLP